MPLYFRNMRSIRCVTKKPPATLMDASRMALAARRSAQKPAPLPRTTMAPTRMMPLMAFEITFSIEILKNFLPVFVEKGLRGIEADRERTHAYYISSPSLATALNPLIGYAAAAEIAKESAKTGTPIPDLLRQKKLLSEEKIREIFTPDFLAGQADRK